MEQVGERCGTCGEVLGKAGEPCRHCGAPSATYHPVTFIVFIVILAAAFGITRVVVTRFEHRQQDLATRWYDRGIAALQQNRPADAIIDFETTLAYERDNRTARLHLAQALIAAGQGREARVHLLNLYDTQPGDATVNLELARLAAASGRVPDAMRWYHGAVYAVWEDDPVRHRADARLEFARFLLDHNDTTQAQAELIAAAGEMPPSVDMQVSLGQLLMRAGEPRRAMNVFQHVLEVKRDDADAVRGAAEASLTQADYVTARRYYAELTRLNPKDDAAAHNTNLLEMVERLDPQARRLSANERDSRVLSAFGIAKDRMQACPALASALDLQTQMAELQRRANAKTLRADSEAVSAIMDFVYRVEQSAATSCSAGALKDEALLVLAQRGRGAK